MNIIAVLANSLSHASAAMSWRGLRALLEHSLSGLPAATQVLNVGAGGRTGTVLGRIKADSGFELTSLDIDPARQPDVVADIVSYAPPRQYDVIVMIEVLEHVHDPLAAVRNLRRLLKPGGMLVLSAPFMFPLHDRPHDFYRFTRYGLELMLAEFEAVEVKERDSWAEVLCVLLARMSRERSFGARVFAPVAVLAAIVSYPLAMLLVRLVRSDALTIGYTVTARKPARALG